MIITAEQAHKLIRILSERSFDKIEGWDLYKSAKENSLYSDLHSLLMRIAEEEEESSKTIKGD